MNLNFKINSLYVCVRDMKRAIDFYEKLLNQKVTEESEIYSVFDINGFRYGLFAYEMTNEHKEWGNNCLPSLEVSNMKDFIKRLNELKCEIVFPLTVIGRNEVLEFKDSEGNYIEVASPIKGD